MKELDQSLEYWVLPSANSNDEIPKPIKKRGDALIKGEIVFIDSDNHASQVGQIMFSDSKPVFMGVGAIIPHSADIVADVIVAIIESRAMQFSRAT